MAMQQLESSLTGDHQLIEQRVSCINQCDKCHNYFHGSKIQGVVCQECGLSWHRICATTGLSRCNTHRRNLISAIFGKELSCQFLPPDQNAPILVLRCINEIETRGASHSDIDLYKVYRTSTASDIVAELRQKLSEDVEHTNLASYELHCIASALKKYLRELPNPVFPVQFYDKFIKAAKYVWNDDQCVQVLEQLVHQFPIHHKSTLQTLMAHFCRICRLQYSRGIKEPPTSVIEVLGRILLKPPWERTNEIVCNTIAHIRIVELLLLKGNWGEDMPIFDSAPEVMMLGSSVSISPNSNEYISPRIEEPKNLNDEDWYWGDITREEVDEILKDTPDGAFLVTDDPNKRSGEYILTLRKGGRNNLIKIYHRNGKYSITEPLDFNSVVELINYRYSVTLAQNNHALDDDSIMDFINYHYHLGQHQALDDMKLFLLYPISRFHPIGFDEDESLDVENLCEKLIKINKEYVQKVTHYDQLNEAYEKTNQDVKLKKQAIKLCDVKVAMIKEKLEMNECSKTATPNEIKLLEERSKLIMDQKTIESEKIELDTQLKRQVELETSIDMELDTLYLEIDKLLERRKGFQIMLYAKGVKQDIIHKLLSNVNSYKEAMDMSAQEEERRNCYENLWFARDFSRNDVIKVLTDKPQGAFLIRNVTPGQYELSVVADGEVVHCLINKTDQGYGFAESSNVYQSLKSLVIHYVYNSLEHSNALKTTLTYPGLMKVNNEGDEGDE